MTTNSWKDTLAASTKKAEAGAKYKKQAGILLWDGAKAAISEHDSGADADGERLYTEVLDALGGGRKGDASKIKTVALAVANNGLDLDGFDNLSKAYAEATRLTKTVKIHADEDDAADAAVRNITAPKTSSTAEGAALIVLSKGVDEAARLLLAALGTTEHAAHKAFIRAISQEAAGLIPKPEPKAKKAAAPKGAAKKAVAKDGASKEKVEAAAPAKAKPVKRAKPKPVEEAPVEDPIEDEFIEPEVEDSQTDDMFADLDDDADLDSTVEEAPAPAKKAAKPVRRGPVRRG